MPCVRGHEAAVEPGDRVENQKIQRAVGVEEDTVDPFEGVVVAVRAALARQDRPAAAAALQRRSSGEGSGASILQPFDNGAGRTAQG